MSKLEDAIRLARTGFQVFPIVGSNVKFPCITDWQNKATRVKSQIRAWWSEWPENNIGLSCDNFLDSKHLLVLDIDKDKGGFESLKKLLEDEKLELPHTLKQRTHSGGEHHIFFVEEPVSNSVNVFGKKYPGIDIRSKGGYIVGAGSTINDKKYELDIAIVQDAPDWLLQKCKNPAKNSTPDRKERAKEAATESLTTAQTRAIHYLKTQAPLAIQGKGGDHTTFVVAATLKDMGVNALDAYTLMDEHWNPRCEPPWDMEPLFKKIENAFAYGKSQKGVDSPEKVFTDIKSAAESKNPIEQLNSEYAFLQLSGSHVILQETKGPNGEFSLNYLNEQTFHRKFAAWVSYSEKGKPTQWTQEWMKAKERRTYDGLVFDPKGVCDARFYNLWKGFSVQAPSENENIDPRGQAAFDAFLFHTRQNICSGNENLYRWLITYFAHFIQKPWERPNVCIVLKGRKGVGKNAFIQRIAYLAKNHSLVAADRRYLVGNFNGHLENILLFVLDEAYWAGDKQAEGQLKHLISGDEHVIERKGKEAYRVDNCIRLVILGNEEWVVPASEDERRFAVFTVGESKMQDTDFFYNMRIGMEKFGGAKLLIKFLKEWDLKTANPFLIPKTKGLYDQKMNSLPPLLQWWFECLNDGRILSYMDDWEKKLSKDQVERAYRDYVKEHSMGKYLDSRRVFAAGLKRACPSLTQARSRVGDGSEKERVYLFPSLEEARKEWEEFIGHEVDWE